MAGLVPCNPPYIQSWLPRPSRRYTSLKHLCFHAWRSCKEEELYIDPRAYAPSCCVTLHMYDLRGDFRCHLKQLYTMLWDLFSNPACKDMIGIIGVATTLMPFPEKAALLQGRVLQKGALVGPGQLRLLLILAPTGANGKTDSATPH